MIARSLGALLGAAAIALVTALPAQAAVTISAGHVDVLDIDWTGTALTLDLRDDTVTPAVDRNPADVTLRVVTAARTTVPSGSAWSFLGAAGSPVWILPQSQRAGIVWPGWSTDGVPSGALQNNTVTLKLVSVTGPDDVSVYTTNAFGSPTVLFDSGNGLPDTRTINVGTHAHANWAFEAAGTYTVGFEVTATKAGGGTLTTGVKTYTFTVDP